MRASRDARPLAATERANLALHFVAAETKGAETILNLASIPQRPLIPDCIVQRFPERKVAEVLTKPRRRN
jgi:hypothetical protein